MNTHTPKPTRVGATPALLRLFCLFVFAFIAGPARAQPYPPPVHPDNGVFITKKYVAENAYATTVTSDLCYRMKTFYGVRYLFVNIGKTDANGAIMNTSSEMTQIKTFLNTVKAWENANGHQFVLLAWVNGNLGPTTPNNPQYDVADAAKRATLAESCRKFVSASVPGSYVSGANRTFDGIMMDLEPSGFDGTRFNHLQTLMDTIRSGFNSAGLASKLTGICGHKLGATNEWQWSQSFYHYMARKVNFVVSMSYNSSTTTGTAYRTWMQNQTTGILTAVSGKAWNFDANHPAPGNGVKVFIGFPAYPAGSGHTPSVENAANAGLGTEDGLAILNTGGNTFSAGFLQGAAMFMHTDGTGSDGYATWSTDWWQFGRYWLHTW